MPRARLWDAPVRLFHWALALLVLASFTTGKLGGNWMEWHLRSGYCILALLLFRVMWGFVGSGTARFGSFLKGPAAVAQYVGETLQRRHPRLAGHNPLGGWMVVAMIAILLLQAATGLLADDEVATQGPLSILASAKLVSRANTVHEWNQYVILAAIGLHVVAIAVYQWVLKVDLLGPMFHGGTLPEAADSRGGAAGWAVAAFVVACAAVYCIVVFIPRLA